MGDLKYDTLMSRLVEVVPELKARIVEEVERWGDEQPGVYIIFEDILVPFIFEMLRSQDKSDILHRIFDFLEQMALHPDEDIRNVVEVGVCESMSGRWDKGILAQAREYMGPATGYLSHRIAVYKGHELPHEDDPPEIKVMAPPNRASDGYNI